METINDIKLKFSYASFQQLNDLIQQYTSDNRKGVQNIVHCYQKKAEAYQKEQSRLESMLLFERECYHW